MSRKANWEGKGVNIAGEYLNHLRFADDISNTTEALTNVVRRIELRKQTSRSYDE